MFRLIDIVVHIMYVDYARASDNEFQENVTGMMIMITNKYGHSS